MGDVISTRRLDLIPATLESCAAELRGHAALSAWLQARVPNSWPPEVFEPDDVERIRKQLVSHPEPGAWVLHYVVVRDTGSPAPPTRELAGVAGFTGPPGSDGAVEIGYAIAPEHQRRGYATEAVEALVAVAFADVRVRTVRAHTYPHLEPSIGVLRKIGFAPVDAPSDPGTVRFERTRDRSRDAALG